MNNSDLKSLQNNAAFAWVAEHWFLTLVILIAVLLLIFLVIIP